MRYLFLLIGFMLYPLCSYAQIERITTELSLDSTPQLSGNLDLNSNNITGIGTDTQVCYSAAGTLTCGDAGLVYNAAANTLTLTGPVISTFDTPTARTASHTFALTDRGANIRYDSAGSLTATVPPNSSVAFPVGQRLFGEIFDGANTLTLVAGPGVTINTHTSLVYTSGSFGLVKTATDTWTAVGGD